MKLVIQRVSKASVTINKKIIAKIGHGLLILIGVGKSDKPKTAQIMAQKILNLRIFEDKNDKMNLSITNIGGEILLVPQFTLLANLKKGRRPYFGNAAPPALALKIIKKLVNELRKSKLNIKEGQFGAKMEVELINHGPVTIMMNDE